MQLLKVCLFESRVVSSDTWNFVHALHPLGYTWVFGLHGKGEILLIGLGIGSIQLQDLHHVLQLVEHCNIGNCEVWPCDINLRRIGLTSSDWLTSFNGRHELRKRLITIHRLNLNIVIRSNLLLQVPKNDIKECFNFILNLCFCFLFVIMHHFSISVLNLFIGVVLLDHLN